MDDQNKKQIVIIVVIIIVLVLMLLGVLVVAVVTNKSSGGSLSNNTTMAVDNTKTTQSAVMSTTTSSQADLSNDGNNTENTLIVQGIDNYLATLKSEGRIGEYIIGDVIPVSGQDVQTLCSNIAYDPMKGYVSTVIDYVKISGAQSLSDVEEYFADRAYASVYFSMNFEGSVYVVEEMFSC